jgi:site-specific DNA-cytosine methylase
MVIFA